MFLLASYPSSSYRGSTVVEFISFFIYQLPVFLSLYIYIPECQSNAILFSSSKLNLVILSSLVTLTLHEMSDLYTGERGRGLPYMGLA